MSRQINIYVNNDVFNYSISGRQLEPEEVNTNYTPEDPDLNIFLPPSEPAVPGYAPESPDYAPESPNYDAEMLSDSESDAEMPSEAEMPSDVEMLSDDSDDETMSTDDSDDDESADDCLIIYGPETWEATRRRLNMKAIINGEVRFEVFDYDQDIIDLTNEE